MLLVHPDELINLAIKYSKSFADLHLLGVAGISRKNVASLSLNITSFSSHSFHAAADADCYWHICEEFTF